MILQGLIGQLNNHKVNYLHNLQTITIGCYVTITVNSTVNKYRQVLNSVPESRRILSSD